MTQKPWEGRFADRTHRSVEVFTASIDVDRRLYAHDIEGSMAHAKMMAKTGMISDEECSQLIEGLGKIRREIERGEFTFSESLEDIHMHIENRLFQLVGKAAQKLHTARSRNDQVALDIRLYLREETLRVLELLTAFRQVLLDAADRHLGVILPGYTHLQRAQPVLFSHHLLAYYEMLSRDTLRFRDSLKRTNVMPLGNAALAGTTYPIDREYAAELMNFPEISANSIDGVSDRDFIMEFIAAASICMVHLSRLSEELVLWSSSEFQFIELPDAFATGSSIMPQKKNPDVPELVRGKAGRIFGDLMAILTTMKALPLAYNRDMQEDKTPLFSTVDTLKSCLDIYVQMIPRLNIHSETMAAAASKGYLSATDFADYLAAKGMPFREAHGCAGKAVAYAIEKQKELHELSLHELKGFAKIVEADVFDMLTVQQMIDRRICIGGTATPLVRQAIAKAVKDLAAESLEGSSESYTS